jgi:hypothetical protein
MFVVGGILFCVVGFVSVEIEWTYNDWPLWWKY